MARYGIPYMGSKGPIADWVLSHIPSCENFYDLFGGGFAITHSAMLSEKWKYFHFNEIKSDVVDLIKDSIAGKYSYHAFKPEFITKEIFEDRKHNCAYTRIIWSFGNNQRDYLFGKDIELNKMSLHNAVVFNQFDNFACKLLDFNAWPIHLSEVKSRRLFIAKKAREKRDKKYRQLQQLEQLERLQKLEQLEQLERLERLERLELTSISYEHVNIGENSVVYCDIPYFATKGYGGTFDHEEFYRWARKANFPVYISEYYMPEDFFLIATKPKKQKLAPSARRAEYIENIYANKAGLEFYKQQMNTLKNFYEQPEKTELKSADGPKSE